MTVIRTAAIIEMVEQVWLTFLPPHCAAGAVTKGRSLVVAKSDRASRPSLHTIGRLYGQWAFNFMVDIARAIADDFVERPQHYRNVPGELSRVLSGFRTLMGSHPDWPDAQQRLALFRVLGAACLAGAPLREAALVYAEAGTEVNRDLLRMKL